MAELNNYDFYRVKKSKLFDEKMDNVLSLSEISGKERVHVVKAFCNDLRLVLSCVHVNDMIEKIFQIDLLLQNIQESNSVAESSRDGLQSDQIPSLSEFYKSLSPILLRSLWENSDNSELSKVWLESLRVAIEEELYFWQEGSESS